MPNGCLIVHSGQSLSCWMDDNLQELRNFVHGFLCIPPYTHIWIDLPNRANPMLPGNLLEKIVKSVAVILNPHFFMVESGKCHSFHGFSMGLPWFFPISSSISNGAQVLWHADGGRGVARASRDIHAPCGATLGVAQHLEHSAAVRRHIARWVWKLCWCRERCICLMFIFQIWLVNKISKYFHISFTYIYMILYCNMYIFRSIFIYWTKYGPAFQFQPPSPPAMVMVQ